MKKTTLLLFAFVQLMASCNNSAKHYNPQKFSANDPFRESMVKSEFFEFNAAQGHVVEGEQGTLISFPQGCFVNSAGQEVKDMVKVELAEALDYGDMILSNLTTTSNGKLLETDGMIYINATTVSGESLFINKEKPVYVQIPTPDKRAGMMAYRGERSDNGNMNWVDPKVIENYLIPVDFKQLDFLPKGFASEVKLNMPFKDYKVATPALVDSLYYSLSMSTLSLGNSVTPPQQEAINMNEPYYNPNRKIENGQYTQESYQVNQKENHHGFAAQPPSDTVKEYGIDPAMIKAIRDEKYQQTFLATREFESRIQAIFQTCQSSILMLYVNNIEKNLWEVDDMAARQLGEESYMGKQFKDFAAMRQTNVRDAGEHAALLKGYFEQRLNDIRNELSHLEDEATRQVKEHNRVVDSVKQAYQDLLWKREKYRMERYGFEWTGLGWINIDTGTVEKDWFEKKLEVTVQGGKHFDRVETYIVFESMRSISHLETLDKEVHFVGQDPKRSMLMPRLQPSKIVSVAYRGDSVYAGVTDYITGSTETAAITLSATDEANVKRVLNEIETGKFKGQLFKKGTSSRLKRKKSQYVEENSVALDLAYQSYFYKESKFQEQQQRDRITMESLYVLAFPCLCESEVVILKGKSLFTNNCMPCHNVNTDGTGPALAGLTKIRPMQWLIRFTRNYNDLVDHKDPVAIDVVNSRPSAMNLYLALSDCDIRSIFIYADFEAEHSMQ